MKDSFFTADLYQYNILVAQLHITITDEDYTIDVAKVIVPQLMPCPEQLLKLWFRCRGMANNTQHYIALINHIFNFKNPRIRHAYFVLSLLNGSYNYVDKYWISINKELSFDFYGQKITYKPISYQTINNLQNHINKEIDGVLLYDILFFEKAFSKYHDLCYMTNGTKQSRWVQDGERLLFEKREDAALIKKRNKSLKRFKRNWICGSVV